MEVVGEGIGELGRVVNDTVVRGEGVDGVIWASVVEDVDGVPYLSERGGSIDSRHIVT